MCLRRAAAINAATAPVHSAGVDGLGLAASSPQAKGNAERAHSSQGSRPNRSQAKDPARDPWLIDPFSEWARTCGPNSGLSLKKLRLQDDCRSGDGGHKALHRDLQIAGTQFKNALAGYSADSLYELRMTGVGPHGKKKAEGPSKNSAGKPKVGRAGQDIKQLQTVLLTSAKQCGEKAGFTVRSKESIAQDGMKRRSTFRSAMKGKWNRPEAHLVNPGAFRPVSAASRGSSN